MAETASVLAAIFTSRYWQPTFSTSCGRTATQIAFFEKLENTFF
jgi:hypothetical protein